jgi:hypothetical protein
VVPVGSGLVAAGVLVGLARRAKEDQPSGGWVVVGVATSPMATEAAILAKAATAYGQPLPGRVQYHHLPPQGPYEKPHYTQLQTADGRVWWLDPYYAAKAAPLVPRGGLLWVPGRRPLELCSPPE